MKIYLIGHKSPDLDAIASPIVYADFLKHSETYPDAELIPVVSGEPNKESKYIFEKIGIGLPVNVSDVSLGDDDKIILMDHNEESQRHEMVEAEKIIEIVDHHKTNVNFTNPVKIDVKPVGSTSTVVYDHFVKAGIEPADEIKQLILAAILSDTVGLKSSTTTGIDSEFAHKLADEIGVKLDDFTFEIFKAKSDITGLSAMDLAKKDFKVFEFGNKKVFINQIETVQTDEILALKDDLVDALKKVKEELGTNQAYIVVTDILEVNSQVIYGTEEEQTVIEKAFTTEGSDNVADIGPKMSRKKDIAPAIEQNI